MARPSPWLGRISEIRRSVRESVCSQCSRYDIENLFRIQPSPVPHKQFRLIEQDGAFV